MMRVEDFAVGVVGLIGNPKAYNEAFNVCGDETPSFRDVLNVISKWLNKEAICLDISSEFYANEAKNYTGEIKGGRALDSINSNKKLKETVPPFKQSITYIVGVEKTLRAYMDNNYEKGISWEFDAQCDRIIKKWCIQNGVDYSSYNLNFIDYLGYATIKDKLTYFLEINNDYKWSKFIKLILRILKKLHFIM